MASTDTGGRVLEQMPSGIAGLDVILRGGFPRAGISIIQGAPGAGKTILGNQICFHHVTHGGGRALYVTLLAESHARMLMHMGQLGFFNDSVIPGKLYYISAFRTLEEHGLRGLLDLLRREVQAHGASVLVLDGLVAAEETASSAREFKKFIHELQAQATINDCTMFLLTGAPSKPVSAEHTMVDGVIELCSELYGRRAERHLQVLKMRGVGVLRGQHSMRIADCGMQVFPRIEALLAEPSQQPGPAGAPVPTGLAELDRMAGGGLPQGSTTLLIGPPGCGKTTLGLHYLSQCSAQEPGLLFGFYETPAALVIKARALGLAVESLIADGAVELLWQATTEAILDQIGERLHQAIKRRGVKRLFIDGIGGFEKLAPDRQRLAHILAAFNNEFQALGVTTILASEADVMGGVMGLPLSGLSLQGVSPVAQNIIVMRFVELRSRLHRMLSVLKVRDAAIDPCLHEFTMTAAGITIEPDPASAEKILANAVGRQAAARPAGGT